MSGYDYASAITGCTTDVHGRFALRGPSFEMLADGSVASGGPGRAPGPLDLLVSALVANLLNVLHDGQLVDTGPRGDAADEDRDAVRRDVQVRARVTRYPAGRLKVGLLTVDVRIGGHDDASTRRLLADYRNGCRVLPAVETVVDVALQPAASDAAA
ncbi:hypothetical protein KVF89_24240 [Nocardioides carbamazepini]|uniref:hypothetical protein n=1 Tax=Nocardioides carbamazepini TaxID=2854259 RepID=UPI00214A1372|nr:hypothetical protein [Nocardioides carbamazepini]MCR1785668.1 hypothetical protein [Nocardioides carbamazepini]